MLVNNFRSSAKKSFLQVMTSDKSLINSRNNNGPKLDPCGTPDVTV